MRSAALVAVSVATVLAAPAVNASVRVKELGHFDGVRKNQLIGYGLVVGLDGTGDSEQAGFSPQSLEAMLSRLGVRVDKQRLLLRNVAAVTVTAELPPFSRPGVTIDVMVSSIGNARSLVGGTLLMTPLKGANGETYAVAQGPVQVGSAGDAEDWGRAYRGRLNVGRVSQGALVEREVPVTLGEGGVLRFLLARPDFRTAAHLADAVNRQRTLLGLQADAAEPPAPGVVASVSGAPAPGGAAAIARPVDAGTVEIAVPEAWRERIAGLIATLEWIEVEPDARARVVVSGSTGAVVLGGEVRISRVAIAYDGVSLAIGQSDEGDDPRLDDTPDLKVIEQSTTLAEVVRGLNRLGVGARGLVDILQALASAGALHAELEVVP